MPARGAPAGLRAPSALFRHAYHWSPIVFYVTVASELIRTPGAGFFGPGSMVWKVNREALVLLGGGARALLLQVAHPLVAAAVAEHSRYRTDPVGRLRHTLDASYAFAFADSRRAAEAVAAVTHMHGRVHGVLQEGVGCHPAGQPYSALDPHLLLWVYATLMDSAVLAYETFVSPLGERAREAYYTEGRSAGPAWGVHAADLPPTFAELRRWMAAQIGSGEVAVGSQARDIARQLLLPAELHVPSSLLGAVAVPCVWLLPPVLRNDFGFSWGRRREAFMRSIAAASRATSPHLPHAVRDLPVARSAFRRMQHPR